MLARDRATRVLIRVWVAFLHAVVPQLVVVGLVTHLRTIFRFAMLIFLLLPMWLLTHSFAPHPKSPCMQPRPLHPHLFNPLEMKS